jgi:hypothetical protein
MTAGCAQRNLQPATFVSYLRDRTPPWEKRHIASEYYARYKTMPLEVLRPWQAPFLWGYTGRMLSLGWA